ncbi:MAG: hypothetical protein GC160_19525 [Acidobacteria bacterium]|nr:hypothetical protein [Acidobacteriota bacterium]
MPQIKHGRWVTPAGQGVSSALRLESDTLVGFYTPSALDSARLGLQASHDGQTFADIVSEGEAWTMTGDADAYIPLDATRLLGAAYVRLTHLDAQGAAAVESSERVFLPAFRSFE